ncbi:MAG: ABC transporter substrate-binding protein [Pseudomonadota bacterium]
MDLKTVYGTARTSLLAGTIAAFAPIAALGQSMDMTLQVYPGSLVSLPEYVGAAAGIYERNGLNVDLLPLRTGPDSIAGAASGSADAVSNSLGNTLLANGQGQDLVLVANAWNAPLFSWMRQPGYEMSGLDVDYPGNLSGFRGARIGVAGRGTETELFTRVLLSDAGIDPETEVTWVPVGFGQTAVAAFEAEQVDIIITMEPVQTILTARGTGEMLIDLPSGEGPELFRTYPGVSRIALRSHVQENPELFEAYLTAHDEVIAFISDPANVSEVAAIFAEASGQPMEIATAIVSRYTSVWQNVFDCQGYQNVLDYLVASGQFAQELADQAQSCNDIVAGVSQGIIIE